MKWPSGFMGSHQTESEIRMSELAAAGRLRIANYHPTRVSIPRRKTK